MFDVLASVIFWEYHQAADKVESILYDEYISALSYELGCSLNTVKIHVLFLTYSIKFDVILIIIFLQLPLQSLSPRGYNTSQKNSYLK